MAGLGRMHEEGGSPGAGQGRSDLAPDMSGLAHAADDDPTTAIEDQAQRLQEGPVDAVGQRQDGVGFDAQNLPRQIERLR